jgi:cytochrome c
MRSVLTVALMLVMARSTWAEDKVPSYVKDIKPIFDTNCARCHKSENKKGGFDISSVAAILKGGKRGKKMLVPGTPDKSPVLRTMEGHGKVMPPRKQKIRPTKEEVATVRAWIVAGAKDDAPAKKE